MERNGATTSVACRPEGRTFHVGDLHHDWSVIVEISNLSANAVRAITAATESELIPTIARDVRVAEEHA